ncbi:MAG TPA: Rieske 2Fe-2S domain-containing protein, partial [Actinomycetota bacterium]|nr:Rieske 2Fe-2S domain-containing protein [Actinomycetota bacterium]
MAELTVCPLDELPAGTMKLVHAGEISVGVYNVGGELYAIEDRCSHDDGPLVEGDWEPDEAIVVCPSHGATFASRTGK